MKCFKNKYDRKSCVDEVRINRYVLHRCSANERQEIEAHLVECPLCRTEVVILTRAQLVIRDKREWGELPEPLYNKSMKLIRDLTGNRTTFLLICLGFIKGKWKIIRHTGLVIPQPVLAARGDTFDKKANLLNVCKEFDGFQVEADLTGSVQGTVDLQIRIKGSEKGDLIPQVQFTLSEQKNQRLLEELVRDGEVFFKGLIPNVYSIRIACQERLIGEIILDLNSD